MKKCDVLIIGGGPAGLALACLMADHGLDITLADAGPPPAPPQSIKPDSRTAALIGGSIDLLKDIGVWPVLQPLTGRLARMTVIDDSHFPKGADSMVEQVFSASELGRNEFGWNVPLSALRAALHACAQTKKSIIFYWNTPFETAKNKIEYKLMIGCDGRDSQVRQSAGIKATRRPYGQKAITCLFTHTRPHDDTSIEFHRNGGPFTYVPLSANTCSVVWVEEDDDADAFLQLPKPAFTRALAERTRGRLGKIELLTNPTAWPLEFLRAEKLTAPRVALAAEAAHVISPIGAQGLNLSLRDIQALADIVTNAAALGLDIGSHTVLQKYERARKTDVASRTYTIDLANQAVASDTAAIRALRRMTLRALSLPGPWRKLVMKKGLAA